MAKRIDVVVKGMFPNVLGASQFMECEATWIDENTLRKAFSIISKDSYTGMEIKFVANNGLLESSFVVYFDNYEDFVNQIATVKLYVFSQTDAKYDARKMKFKKFKRMIYGMLRSVEESREEEQ